MKPAGCAQVLVNDHLLLLRGGGEIVEGASVNINRGGHSVSFRLATSSKRFEVETLRRFV